jgi:hypothetical protein
MVRAERVSSAPGRLDSPRRTFFTGTHAMTIDELTATGVAFKAIPGYSNQMAGDDGSIWSCFLVSEKGYRCRRIGSDWMRLHTYFDRKGYEHVSLLIDDRGHRTIRVHQAVLLAFIGPRPEGMQGCHGDGNPRNNRLDNLRWDTREANEMDKLRHGTTLFKDFRWPRPLKADRRKRQKRDRRRTPTPPVPKPPRRPPFEFPPGSHIPTFVPFSEEYRLYVERKNQPEGDFSRNSRSD